MLEKFLLTFSMFGEFYAEILTMREIAAYVGFSDINEFQNFRVYQIIRGIPEECKIVLREPCIVALYRGEILVDSAEYPEH